MFLKGKFFVLGGFTGMNNADAVHDAYSSTDAGAFAALMHACRAGCMPAMRSGCTAPSWFSSHPPHDGTEVWTALPPAPWSARGYMGAAVQNDRLWIAGGLSQAGYAHDVWRLDASGTQWTSIDTSSAWQPRQHFGCIAQRVSDSEQMLLVAGGTTAPTPAGLVNDVWNSTLNRTYAAPSHAHTHW
ncbi:MAG: hypothetical protein EOO65_00520 [Methanosarcinales archaeon]|nr:MAG: hypothetical protein EOO65_00520 [Methanosarcinales archaeon]